MSVLKGFGFWDFQKKEQPFSCGASFHPVLEKLVIRMGIRKWVLEKFGREGIIFRGWLWLKDKERMLRRAATIRSTSVEMDEVLQSNAFYLGVVLGRLRWNAPSSPDWNSRSLRPQLHEPFIFSFYIFILERKIGRRLNFNFMDRLVAEHGIKNIDSKLLDYDAKVWERMIRRRQVGQKKMSSIVSKYSNVNANGTLIWISL